LVTEKGDLCDHTIQRMREELVRRNYTESTIRSYLHTIEDFRRYAQKRVGHLGPDNIRRYQVYLREERKLDFGTAGSCVAALRFFYVKTLKRPHAKGGFALPERCKAQTATGNHSQRGRSHPGDRFVQQSLPLLRLPPDICTSPPSVCKQRPILEEARRVGPDSTATLAATAQSRMSRPVFELADLIHAQSAPFVDQHRQHLRSRQLKVLIAIAQSRTAALGGHIDDCPRCSH
jgi:hypothetical protein